VTYVNQKLGEMLESHLAEIKQQGESKLRHPEPLAIETFSTPHYTEKTGGIPPPPDTSSNYAWETFDKPNR
jgi:hypothetical protein